MIREEVSLQGLTGMEAYNGKEGWQVQPFAGRKEPERTSAEDYARHLLHRYGKGSDDALVLVARYLGGGS